MKYEWNLAVENVQWRNVLLAWMPWTISGRVDTMLQRKNRINDQLYLQNKLLREIKTERENLAMTLIDSANLDYWMDQIFLNIRKNH